ncbi:MAG: 2-dehydropantoate 2-reductase [Acidobacteriota bacterium]
MQQKPEVLVVGAGAVGGFYGGKLAQAGARVSVVCRSDFDVVSSSGFTVESVLGDFQFMPEKVLRDAADYGPHADVVLVATKVLPEVDVPRLIEGAVGPETAILLIQNGVEVEGPIAAAFPDNELLSGLAFIAVSRTGPGHIRHQDFGRLTIGRYPSGLSERAELLAKLFESSGLPCDLVEEVVTARWQKLVWNAPFNPMSVLGGGVDTQTLLESPESASLILKVMEEVLNIASAVGHPLPPESIERNIEGTRALGSYKTSMLLDFEAGRPMEVEAILGNGVRAARRAGVPVPRMESLYALIQLVDGKVRARGSALP